MIRLLFMILILKSKHNCNANNYHSLSRDLDLSLRSYDIIKGTLLMSRHHRRENDNNFNYASMLRTKDIPTSTVVSDKLKRHVEEGTQKQYEIINLLWRNTKISMNEEDVFITSKQGLNVTQTKLRTPGDNSILSTPRVVNSLSTTSSSIEFYYNDEDQIDNPKVCAEIDCGIKSNAIQNNKSFLIFHLKAPYAIPQLVKLNSSQTNYSRFSRIKANILEPTPNESNKLKPKDVTQNLLKVFENKTKTQRKLPTILINNANRFPYVAHSSVKIDTEPTTVYDKIKFFELYDQFTEKSIYKSDKNGSNKDTKINNSEKIQLKHVDQSSHDHDQSKLSKKHIKGDLQTNMPVNKEKIKSNTFIINAEPVKHDKKHTANITKSNVDIGLLSYVSENVSWTEYPFAALYLNEPSQVHCDAAAISPHWLVASGACLSRVSKDLGETQSAFVAYCGDHWWQPERVAYVKYILVHPSYNPRDRNRRHLYNIGVIQVVTSMLSACVGWAPVSVISHQSAANPAGIEASAVGWGLDRFGTRYGATNLPKIPLMIYKGLVYFGSCPGNVGYSKALESGDGKGVKYIHCLMLPPYTSEANDPVHGGLLLVGGKLIALYLQEERRPWGHQSAHYTGIWPLVPWLMDVTREHEIDPFIFQM